jgi:foldase protein PrsA
MHDLQSIIIASANGTALSLQELLHTLKLQGKLSSLIAGALAEKVIAAAAKQEGIHISTEELQKAADAFRLRHGLNKAADTQRWLTRNGLTPADLEEGVQRGLLRQKLAAKVTAGQIEKYFAANRPRFDRARLRRIVVEKEGVAHELLSRIQEDGADFADLARQHSIDSRTRAGGGNLGIVRRQGMPPALDAAVFGASHGATIGPLKTDAGYVLIQVEEILLGRLDEANTPAIQEHLFCDWLARQLQNGKAEMNLGT